MSDFVKVEKLIAKIEKQSEKNYTIGRLVLLPVFRNGVGALMLMFMIWLVGYVWLGQRTPFQFETYKLATLVICGMLFSAVTFVEIFISKGRVLALAFYMYRLGSRNAARSVPTKVKQPIREESVEQNVPSKNKMLLEDVATLLQDHYSTGKTITRDRSLDLLSNRSNSRKSVEEAMRLLTFSGILKKGPNRNDLAEVVPKNYRDAIEQLKRYIRHKQK